ncbi:MAG: hypothetical protein AAF351_13465 [Pseudomonadota bacterium]
MTRILTTLPMVLLLCACAATTSEPDYPAFVVTDEIEDMFMATLPGVRAKEFALDNRSRTTSLRIDLPEGWNGSSAGTPGKALEVFVIQGELEVADVSLTRGGYAFIPPGSLGFNLSTNSGARILYILSDLSASSTIQTPIILDSNLVDWQATDEMGVFAKDLRNDPGSGYRVWLMKFETDAAIPWRSNSRLREGYLLSGEFQISECVDGRPYTDVHQADGYFRRPADAVHGGPESQVLQESIWFMRETGSSTTNYDVNCGAD